MNRKGALINLRFQRSVGGQYANPSGAARGILINTPLQRGVAEHRSGQNRFNGFLAQGKTVETVPDPAPPSHTLLKQGVNGIAFVFWLLAICAFSVHAQTNLAFKKVRLDTNGLFLQWDGAYPPFALERTSTPAIPDSWLPVPVFTNDNACKLDPFSAEGFYRVRGVTNPPWGRYLGQWRVFEGEGGGNDMQLLARHRLKSLWDIYEPPGGASRANAVDYLKSLIIKLTYLEENDVVTRIGTFASFPNATIQASSNVMTIQWWTGRNTARKDFTLQMMFPYPLDIQGPINNIRILRCFRWNRCVASGHDA
jgi:hypothetical protein